MWSSLCARLCPNLFLKCHRSCGIRATPPTLCHLHDLLKGPVSDTATVWGPGAQDFRTRIPRDTVQPYCFMSPSVWYFMRATGSSCVTTRGSRSRSPETLGAARGPVRCGLRRCPSLLPRSVHGAPPGSRGGGTGTPALRGGMVRICSCPLIPAEAQTSWEKSGEMRLQAQVMLGGKTGESPSGTRVSHVARG